MELERILLEILSNLYGLLGSMLAHKAQNNAEFVNTCVKEVCDQLMRPFIDAKSKGDAGKLTDVISLIVDFSRGFGSKVESIVLRAQFEQMLKEVIDIFKLPGLSKADNLQQ